MSTCGVFEEAISAYLDGELDDAGGAELFTHLGSCAACRRSFADLSALRAHITAQPLPEVPVRLDRRIARLHTAPAARIARLRAGVHTLWSRRLTIPAPAFALALLLATVTVFVSALLLRTTPAPTGGQQQVMYIMSMPTIEIEGVRGQSSSHGH